MEASMIGAGTTTVNMNCDVDESPACTCLSHCGGILAFGAWPAWQIISLATGNGFNTDGFGNVFLGGLFIPGLIYACIIAYPSAVALKSKCCNRREYTQIRGSDQIALKTDSIYLKRHGIEQV
ncbi:MAG: hypothetical protein K1000chlam3_01381 [Chlamydiae bacterium]|nr:hypothetical protein [Chlamydiota bacterium]